MKQKKKQPSHLPFVCGMLASSPPIPFGFGGLRLRPCDPLRTTVSGDDVHVPCRPRGKQWWWWWCTRWWAGGGGVQRHSRLAEQGRASAAGQQSHLLSDGSVHAGSPPIHFGFGLRWRPAADSRQRRWCVLAPPRSDGSNAAVGEGARGWR